MVKRFISPDSTDYLTENGDFDGYNLYAYCVNNPVNYSDATGTRIGAGCARGPYFIDSQGADIRIERYTCTMGSMPFGLLGNVAQNGCGAIACYNVLESFWQSTTFTMVYDYFNKNRHMIASGKGGLKPASLVDYLLLKFKSVSYRILPPSRTFSIYRNYGAVIVLYGNSKGFHYVAGIKKSGNKFAFYNTAYADCNNPMTILDFYNQLRKNGKSIYAIIAVANPR